jgi:hypothetical protein
LEAVYFAFGDADFFIIFDVPDNVSAAALSLVANQSGFVTSKIVVLVTPRRDGPRNQKNCDDRVSATGTLTIAGTLLTLRGASSGTSKSVMLRTGRSTTSHRIPSCLQNWLYLRLTPRL